MAKRKTHDEFLEEMGVINPSIKIHSEYVNAKTKMECECLVCGNMWNTDPDHLLRGRGCPVCSGKMKKKYGDFIKELRSLNPNIEVVGDYINNKTNTSLTCKICGHAWNATPHNLLRGTGCPKCAGVIRKTHEKFVDEMKSVNSNIKIDGIYVNAKTKIRCTCLTCNHVWYAKPNGLLQGKSCPSCALMISRGEERIREYFENSGIEYEDQKKFDGLVGYGRQLSYDFYVKSKNLLVEFQGRQHYFPVKKFGGEKKFLKQQEYDDRKRKYAKDNNIRLLEISYKDYDEIENILNKELHCNYFSSVAN